MADDNSTDILRRLADELKLQAWLASAEIKHPSLQHDGAREEISMLAQARDELRVQMHLGRRDAGDEWDRIEQKWGVVKRLSAAADDLTVALDEILGDIREGYANMRSSDD